MLRQRRPRIELPRHLAFIRELPSLVAVPGPVEAAHIRYAELRYGKEHTGMGEKPDDFWVVPLAHDAHMAQHHAGDERAWWEAQGIDPCLVASLLYSHSGREEEARMVISMARYWPIKEIVA
jgi:hypothetical protein